MNHAADPIDLAKRTLRESMRRRLAALAPSDRQRDSEAIRRHLVRAPGWNHFTGLLAFLPLASEPDLLPLLDQTACAHRTVALLRWNPASAAYEPARYDPGLPLAPGPYGVLEPGPTAPAVPVDQLDLILVPGLAFDAHGRRLGRGRGFFDRCLQRMQRARRWGIAFEFQCVPEIPVATHDQPVDALVTPQAWLPAVALPRY